MLVVGLPRFKYIKVISCLEQPYLCVSTKQILA